MVVVYLEVSFKNFHTDCHSGCTNLHFHQQWKSLPAFVCLFSYCDWDEWNMRVVLIIYFLMTEDIQHFFHVFIGHCYFFFFLFDGGGT
jgi:hypothetical protein